MNRTAKRTLVRTFMRTLISISVFLVASSAVYSQASAISLMVEPGAGLPVGPASTAGTPLYAYSMHVGVRGIYASPDLPSLRISGNMRYARVATPTNTALTLLSFGPGIGWHTNILGPMGLGAQLTAGYSVGFYGDAVGGTPFAAAEGSVSYELNPAFSLALAAGYEYHHSLYHGANATLKGRLKFGTGGSRIYIEIINIDIQPVFPVFQTYYEDHPIGTLTFKNREKTAIRDVEIAFFAESLMVSPKSSGLIRQIESEGVVEIPLYALFTDKILEITENTKMSGEILVSYSIGEESKEGVATATIPIYHRNAMTWDDDRKAASFITSKDPAILELTKETAGLVRATGTRAVSSVFRQAMGMFIAMQLQGINYVVDPTSPYIELSKNSQAIDYLQFPTQTIAYRAGDCDDLSILYSTLLESIGIETAFVTVPGHIYMAFALDLDARSAKALFSSPDDMLIFEDDRVWVPIETTLVQESFLTAWEKGAEQWSNYAPTGQAALWPNHASWEEYSPVGFTNPNLPEFNADTDEILLRYNNEYEEFVEDQLSFRVFNITERIESADDPNPKLFNQLGILYARFGLYDKAEPEFNRAAEVGFSPAMINLGNLEYARGNLDSAVDFFEYAKETNPTSPSPYVGLAQTHFDLRNPEQVRSNYQELQKISPRIAERFSYLVEDMDSTARASDALETILLWADGEEESDTE